MTNFEAYPDNTIYGSYGEFTDGLENMTDEDWAIYDAQVAEDMARYDAENAWDTDLYVDLDTEPPF